MILPETHPMNRALCLVAAAALVATPLPAEAEDVQEETPESAVGSPPMEMDDPGTPGRGGIEVNFVGTWVRSHPGRSGEALLDANVGLGDRLQLKYERPYLSLNPEGDLTQHGLGATEIGIKWRFIDSRGWAVAVYPQYSFDDAFTL